MQSFFFPLRRIISGLVFLCAFATIATAQDMNAKLPTDPDVMTGKLENGLTYYIRNNHKPANKVELRLVVNAGSILENDNQQGLAHFMEHMNFNGTKNFEKNELVSYLQSIGVQFGADLNAYTSFDQTVYILPIPTDKPGNLETGFQIIEDWAHDALLTDKDIDEERGVVLEESRLGKGAQDRMRKIYFPKLVDGSLYADRLPIGKDDILKSFKYETIRSFYRDWYRPDLQAVIVVGDIAPDVALKMVKDHFGKLKNPAGERARKYVDVAPRKAPDAMVVTDKEATNSMLILSFPYVKSKDFKTVGDYKRVITRELALQMLNRRLNELAQSSAPPFPFASASFSSTIHGYDNFSVFALFIGNSPENAIQAVTGELVKAEQYGFTEAELERARKETMSGMEQSYNERKTTDSKRYVGEYIRAYLDGEPFPGIQNEYKYYKAMLPTITVAEVNKIAKEWVKDKNTFTLITAPEKDDVKLPSEKELLAMTEKGFAQKVEQTKEKAIASQLLAKRPQSGKVINEEKNKGFDATTYTLSNGVKVTIKHTDFKSDEIIMSGVKKGGSNSYGVKDKSNVQFATDVVESMGVGQFAPNDLEKVLAGKNIRVNVSIGDISNTVSGSSTVKDFEDMLQLVYLYLTEPRKDAGLFKAYKEKQVSMLQFLSSNPKAAFYDTTINRLYNNNPLAPMVFPKPEDFDNLNLDRALEIYKKELCDASGYHFFITGNIDAKEAKSLLELYLGSIPASKVTPEFKDNHVRQVKGKIRMDVHRGSEKQSLILAIYSGEVAYSEDLALKASALAEVLNIKVIEELREKMGAIYGGGFRASVEKEPYQHYSIQLQLPCGPENVSKLLAAAEVEIDNLIKHGPDKKDLDKVISQWREKHTTNVIENRYWNGKMNSVLFWGRDEDRVLKYDSYIEKLTPADIQNTAKLLLNGKNEFVSVLYPEEKK